MHTNFFSGRLCKNNGIGDRLRVATEYIVIADRGNPAGGDREQKMILNWLEAKKPNRHSQKPEIFYEIIEQISQSPRLEMFARDKEGLFPIREGWDVFGNESSSSIRLPTNEPLWRWRKYYVVRFRALRCVRSKRAVANSAKPLVTRCVFCFFCCGAILIIK